MEDSQCVGFLRWCLPKLGLRWEGFRKVRRQVCKRIGRRVTELGLCDVAAYQKYLDVHAEEWSHLDAMCRITISRFYRDRRVYDILRTAILPKLAVMAQEKGEGIIRCWSLGCASGEEAYSINLIWQTFLAGRAQEDLEMKITATDAMQKMLTRSREGIYKKSSLKDLPDEMKIIAFQRRGETYVLRDPYRKGIEFAAQDIRIEAPHDEFQLILCRNFVFTYFETRLQQEILHKIDQRLSQGGFLVIGIHEGLPHQWNKYVPLKPCPCILEKPI